VVDTVQASFEVALLAKLDMAVMVVVGLEYTVLQDSRLGAVNRSH